jgi:hypothetical protein
MNARTLSTMSLVKDSTVDTFRWFFPAFKQAWAFLLCLHFIDAIAGDYFSYASEYLGSGLHEETALLAAMVALDILFALLWSSFWTLVLASATEASARNTKHDPWGSLIGKNLNHLLIETVRSFSAILFRAPLLILPALYEYVRLSFVPLVVIFDPSYQAGQTDALDKSRKLVSQHRFLMFLLVLASIALPKIIESSLQSSGDEVWLAIAIALFSDFTDNAFHQSWTWHFSRCGLSPLT